MVINDNWKMETDKLNIILSHRKKVSTGYTWENLGFFATFESALNFLILHEVKDTDLKDIKIIVSKLLELDELIKKLSTKKSEINKLNER